MVSRLQVRTLLPASGFLQKSKQKDVRVASMFTSQLEQAVVAVAPADCLKEAWTSSWLANVTKRRLRVKGRADRLRWSFDIWEKRHL